MIPNQQQKSSIFGSSNNGGLFGKSKTPDKSLNNNKPNIFQNPGNGGLFGDKPKISPVNSNGDLFRGSNPPSFTGGIFGKPLTIKQAQEKNLIKKNYEQNLFNRPLSISEPKINLFPSTNVTYPQFNNVPKTVNEESYMKLQNQLLESKKDHQIQRQTTEHLLRRIKELELENQKLKEKNQNLEEQVKKCHEIIKIGNPNMSTSSSLPSYNQPAQNQQSIKTFLNFLGKRNLNQSPNNYITDIQVAKEKLVFTEKVFQSQDGYTIQTYILFNSYYKIKHIILQKVQNQTGSLVLLENNSQKLFWNKVNKYHNWYLYHEQSKERNVIPQVSIDILSKKLVQMMQTNDNSNIPLSINFGKFLEIVKIQGIPEINIFHPDWTASIAYEAKLLAYQQKNNNLLDQQGVAQIENMINKKKQGKNANEIMWLEKDQKIQGYFVFIHNE